jgi:hypothetical protein
MAARPGPEPKIARPRVMWSSCTMRCATLNGWWYGRLTTPVPRPMRWSPDRLRRGTSPATRWSPTPTSGARRTRTRRSRAGRDVQPGRGRAASTTWDARRWGGGSEECAEAGAITARYGSPDVRRAPCTSWPRRRVVPRSVSGSMHVAVAGRYRGVAPRGDVAQLARAPALQAGGRGFESHRLHHGTGSECIRQLLCPRHPRRRPVHYVARWHPRQRHAQH